MRDPHAPCRLCMARSDGIEIIQELVQRISYTVGIKVKSTDNCLTLCKECTEKVNSFFEFKLMCQKTEQEIGPSYNNNSSDTFDGMIKIKKEPGTEAGEFSSSVSSAPVPLKIPAEASWPKVSSGMYFWSTLSQDGRQMVPVQAMVPVGQPISFDSLGLSMPIMTPIMLPKADSSKGAPPMSETTLIKPKQEPLTKISDPELIKSPVPEPVKSPVPEPVKSPVPEPLIQNEKENGSAETATVVDPVSADGDRPLSDLEDDPTLQDVLNQVHTDEEDNDEKRAEVKSRKAGPKCSKRGRTKQSESEDCGKDIRKGQRAKQTTTPSPLQPPKRPRNKEDNNACQETSSTPSLRPKRSCVEKVKKINYMEEEHDSEEESGDDASDPEFKMYDKKATSSDDSDDQAVESDSSSNDSNSVKGKFQEVKRRKIAGINDDAVRVVVKDDGKVTETLEDSKKVGSITVGTDTSKGNGNGADAQKEDVAKDGKVSEFPKPKFNYNGPLKCKDCTRTFRSEVYLKCHERTHKTIERFTCVKCEKTFTTRSDLERHEDTQHANETWECQPCFVAFAQIKTWRAHVKRHKIYPREVQIKIGEEEEKTQNSPSSTSDKSKKLTDASECSTSHKSKTENQTLRNSSKSAAVTEEDVDDPSWCGEDDSPSTRKRKSKGTLFSCKYCKLQFKDKGALICHEMEHKSSSTKKQKSFKCRYCDETFTSSSNKICHEEMSHPKR